MSDVNVHSRELKVGVIGLGKMGVTHACLTKHIAQRKGYCIV